MKKGEKLLNQFEFIERIGSGGVGEIWRARRLNELGVEVAIKVVNHHFENKEAQEILKKEAQITHLLADHPNIRGISEIINHEGQYFLVFDYLKGHDLKTFLEMTLTLKNQGLIDNLSLPFCLSVIEEVSKALDFAHDQKKNGHNSILHRDIKPENIFITKHGEVILYDFGIAKLTESKSETNVTTQEYKTIKYTAPDLWSDGKYHPEKYSKEHDLYSLGVVLFEMLDLMSYRSSNILEAAEEIKNQIEKKLTRDADGLHHILKKLLSLEKESRYLNATDLLNDIKSSSLYSKINSQTVEGEYQKINELYQNKGRSKTVMNFPDAKTKESKPTLLSIFSLKTKLITAGVALFILSIFFMRSPEPKREMASEDYYSAGVECGFDKYNCSDFSTCKEAVEVYAICYAKTGKDIHGLDGRDDDIVPCNNICPDYIDSDLRKAIGKYIK